MTEELDRLAAVALMVALPLVWGLSVEYVFQLLRCRIQRKGQEKGKV